jgi:rhodanese-related sulfurtransferase
MNMKNSIPSLKSFVQLLVAAGCVACASAADTNVTHVNAEQAQKLIADKKVVILDIRTPEEFAAGHIAGATNINFRAANFEKALASLDKSQNYLVHCASGNRSTQALPKFQKLEFKSLYHLDGGLRAWQKAKLPVE